MRRPSELLLLAVLTIVYVLAHVLDTMALHRIMNVVGPLALTLILGWSCYHIVKQSPIAIWAPLFWFRLACAAYFGFGSLVPSVADALTLQLIYDYYRFDEELHLYVNLVYSLGIFLTLSFAQFFLSKSQKSLSFNTKSSSSKAATETLQFAIGFLVLGGMIRYAFYIPYIFGLTDNILAGLLIFLSYLFYVGVYLLVVYGVRHRPRILPLAFTLIVFEIIVSVASFAKVELLLILVFSFLGFLSVRTSNNRIALGAACVLIAYFAFQPLVHYGRGEVFLRYGEIRGAGLEERLSIVGDYFFGDFELAQTSNPGGLLRLSYVNIAAFVIDQRNAGVPGHTFRDAAVVFVPRILWPDKPIITQLGVDLNVLVTGYDWSSIGPGHFAEAYWNFGWWGFGPYMFALALILSVFTRFSMKILADKNWLFLPVVFIGVNMGLRVDGFFVADIIAQGWIALCLGLCLMAVNVGMRSLRRRKAPIVDAHWRGT